MIKHSTLLIKKNRCGFTTFNHYDQSYTVRVKYLQTSPIMSGYPYQIMVFVNCQKAFVMILAEYLTANFQCCSGWGLETFMTLNFPCIVYYKTRCH